MDRRLRRDVVVNLVPVALLGVIGLGLKFLIAIWWGAAALGVFNLVTIAYFVFAVAGACGIQFSVLRAVASAPDDRDHVAAAAVGALVPAVALSAFATAVFVLSRGAVAALHDSDAVAQGMLWAAPGLFCFVINKVLFGIVNGLRRMRAFAVYTSLRYILIGVGLVVVRVADASAEQLPGIWTIAEGTMSLVLAVELVVSVSLARASGWLRWAREHLGYGARGVTATLGEELNSKLDVWMLGAFATPKEMVGVYSLAAALTEGAMQFSLVVQYNLNPMIARALAEKRSGEVEDLVRRTRRWFVPAMVGMCLLGAGAYPVLVPRLLGDPTFSAGAVPFAIMLAGLAIASPYFVFYQLPLMAKLPGWYTLFNIAVVSLNFAAGLALIPFYGPIGAALAMAIALVGSALLLRALARTKIHVRI